MTRVNTSLKFKFYPKLKRYRGLIIIGICVIFINEVLFYRWARSSWPDINQLKNKPTVEKLLLVADPQLIGEKDEGILGFFTRNDADRYLAKTFEQVNAYVKPNWILFLGDLFDEGLSASDDEFHRYFQRFNSIFNYKTNELRYIIVPGDNDVGGEYYGDKHAILRERFRNYFGRNIALYHQNDVQFLKLDVDLSDSYAEGKRDIIMQQIGNHPMSARFRIVLNHWPILTRTIRFIKPFINELEPNIIIKGDSHHFSIISYDRNDMSKKTIVQEYLTQSIYSLDLQEKRFVYEISIPTCSYRMGVKRIGYVVLLLDSETQTAHLTILWTPRRYVSLCIYIIFGIFAVLFWIVSSLFSRRTLVQLLRFRYLNHRSF